MRIRHVKGAEEYVAKDPLVIQAPQEQKGNWKTGVFGSDAPLYLEIGMGMGTFIRTQARLHPDISYIGFEINTTVLYKAVKRYRAECAAAVLRGGESSEEPERNETAKTEELTKRQACSSSEGTFDTEGAELVVPEDCNLRFIRSDARLLTEDFAPGEVDRIYLNFSDPWPKDKNANKRLTSPVFLKLYDQILKPDGVLEFKTDNRGLFDYSVETIPQAGWRIREITYDLHHDAVMNAGNVMTEYEKKFSEKGNPIFKLIADRGTDLEKM